MFFQSIFYVPSIKNKCVIDFLFDNVQRQRDHEDEEDERWTFPRQK